MYAHMFAVNDHPSNWALRPISFVFLLLLSFALPGLGATTGATSGKTLLIGLSVGTSPTHHEYWIGPDSLPGKKLWQPGEEPFPLNLPDEIARASGFAMQEKHLTNRLELQEVSLERVLFRKHPLESGSAQALPAFTNTWIAVFTFLEQPQGPVVAETHWVVMLLDGTYAEDIPRAKRAREREGSSPGSLLSNGASHSSTSLVRAVRPKAQENPYELVRRPDFQVPQIQWNPESAFPLDISELVNADYSSLVQTSSMPQEFQLQEISIQRYFPDGAVPDVGTRFLSHRWHWLIACEFAERLHSVKEFRCYTLLDGRPLMTKAPEL
jgi:hypothetical protein